jgi:SAM-dependent methyltransferase
MDPYEVDARFYDLVHAGQGDADIGLWLSFAGRTDRPVLEVGTGTGRIAVQLALAGHAVVGIDPSEAMLERARARIDDMGAEVTLIPGRVTELAIESEHYGLALVPADVFLYCQDGEEQVATLRTLANCLAFNGLAAIDLPGPASWLDPATNGQPTLVYSGTTDEGTQLDAWQVHDDDLAAQTRWLRVTYEITASDGVVRRTQSEHLLRYVHRFEMEYLLQMAGLAQLDVYGDYELGPLSNESERMIVIARRQAG